MYKEDLFYRPLLDGLDFDAISAYEPGRLDDLFHEEEVWGVLKDTKGDKAPDPDGHFLFS